ncbi:hypothetical protein H4F05_07185 [Vibrio cholerae]
MRSVSLVFAILILIGCAAKGPSEKLASSNRCYELVAKNKLSKITGLVSTEDEIDIRIAEEKLRNETNDWMLKYQQANDISDPVGGISSSLGGLESARDRTKARQQELDIILSRPSIDPRVSEYVYRVLLESFNSCYSTMIPE